MFLWGVEELQGIRLHMVPEIPDGSFLRHGSTPSHHPFYTQIFPCKPSLLGDPPMTMWKAPISIEVFMETHL